VIEIPQRSNLLPRDVLSLSRRTNRQGSSATVVVIVIGGAYLGRSPMFDGNRRDFITLLGEPRPAVWNLIEQGVFEIGSHPGQNSC
jgi:hypothetical protein